MAHQAGDRSGVRKRGAKLTTPDPLPDETESDAQTQASYYRYFSSGTYDRRYPAPNRRMWARIRRKLGADTRVLDFGCGSGRYLFALKGRVGTAIGYDINDAALRKVRQNPAAQDWPELVLIGPDVALLDTYLARHGPVDLVLCLFGVVGHITDAQARAEALRRMAGALAPDGGRLLISVPNARRRFRAEQSAQGALDGLVHYSRDVDGAPVQMHYQLFDPAKLRAELEAAGLRVHGMGCESVLPEDWLHASALARAVDRVLTKLCPTDWGYGIFAEASR